MKQTRKSKETINQKLDRILFLVQCAPAAENNTYGIMHSTLCVYCNKPSFYIFKGNSVCTKCYQKNVSDLEWKIALEQNKYDR